MSYPPPQDEYLRPRKSMSPLAIIGLVIGGCLIVFLIAVVGIAAAFFPVMQNARRAAQRASCTSNMKQIATGLLMYTQDYSDRLPPSATWQTELMPYIRNQSVFACPQRGTAPGAYAYNALLDRLPMSSILAPGSTPAVFESTLGANGSDRLQSFVVPHQGLGNIAYVDGHVKGARVAPQASAGLDPKRKPAVKGRK